MVSSMSITIPNVPLIGPPTSPGIASPTSLMALQVEIARSSVILNELVRALGLGVDDPGMVVALSDAEGAEDGFEA